MLVPRPGAYFNPPSPCGEGHSEHSHNHCPRRNFNPPSPCGEGRTCSCVACPRSKISIHPPRVGRDTSQPPPFDATTLFQSTLPVWGGTPPSRCVTHHGRYFNPPSPCGEGPGAMIALLFAPVFQSTLPVWGGTRRWHKTARRIPWNFNPPSPCGEGLMLMPK